MIAVSKNVYFDVLDDILNKFNNTQHATIKMQPIKLNLILMLNTILILMLKMLNLK